MTRVTFLWSRCVLWYLVHPFVEHDDFRDIIAEAEHEIAGVLLDFEFVKFLDHGVIDFHS